MIKRYHLTMILCLECEPDNHLWIDACRFFTRTTGCRGQLATQAEKYPDIVKVFIVLPTQVPATNVGGNIGIGITFTGVSFSNGQRSFIDGATNIKGLAFRSVDLIIGRGAKQCFFVIG